MKKHLSSRKWRFYFFLPLVLYILFLLLLVVVRTVPIYLLTGESYWDSGVLPRSANLIPFATLHFYINPGNQFVSWLNVLGNMLLFVPCGIYMHLLNKKKKLWPSVLAAFITCLAVEGTQYLLATGVFDVDDILMNFLGALLGVLFAWVLHRRLKGELFVQSAALASFSLIPYLILTLCLYIVYPSRQTGAIISLAVLPVFYALFFLSLRREKAWVKWAAMGINALLLSAYFFMVLPAILM